MIQRLGQFTDIRTALVVGGLSQQIQAATLRSQPEIVVATPVRPFVGCVSCFFSRKMSVKKPLCLHVCRVLQVCNWCSLALSLSTSLPGSTLIVWHNGENVSGSENASPFQDGQPCSAAARLQGRCDRKYQGSVKRVLLRPVRQRSLHLCHTPEPATPAPRSSIHLRMC